MCWFSLHINCILRVSVASRDAAAANSGGDLFGQRLMDFQDGPDGEYSPITVDAKTLMALRREDVFVLSSVVKDGSSIPNQVNSGEAGGLVLMAVILIDCGACFLLSMSCWLR